jgi:mannose-6-phosphate isomerase-like protein (cupin superfamily)
MNRIAMTLSIAAAFAAGCGVTYLMQPAHAAAENITAQVIHTGDLEGDALSPANAGGMRNKTFVSVDGATISIQDGSPPKHLHPNANEIQYILEGTGTIWLGDKEVRVKPGDLVIIPHGTPHGGTKPDGRTIKAIAIKTPPQTPDDIKLLN